MGGLSLLGGPSPMEGLSLADSGDEGGLTRVHDGEGGLIRTASAQTASQQTSSPRTASHPLKSGGLWQSSVATGGSNAATGSAATTRVSFDSFMFLVFFLLSLLRKPAVTSR